ncbi:Arc domain-containing protein [Agrobacterium vitis]|uniref:Arc domain-containing protein n=1 Tax=Agrobacterium vitis TaxID=373 RepID=A0ABD6H8L4_AGRVI|nr:Arc domain-containing protein [Agrobacterium vitis]MUO42614.1 Arc domain-containing protein [Agrobacterium vitis]MUP10583.1 Arc domain-containing protein [Agrobacterium vitis]
MKINLPEDVKFWLEERARKNLRSQSSEIVMALREKMRSNNENEKADATAS